MLGAMAKIRVDASGGARLSIAHATFLRQARVLGIWAVDVAAIASTVSAIKGVIVGRDYFAHVTRHDIFHERKRAVVVSSQIILLVILMCHSWLDEGEGGHFCLFCLEIVRTS